MRSAISLVRNLRSPTAVAAASYASLHDSEIFK